MSYLITHTKPKTMRGYHRRNKYCLYVPQRNTAKHQKCCKRSFYLQNIMYSLISPLVCFSNRYLVRLFAQSQEGLCPVLNGTVERQTTESETEHITSYIARRNRQTNLYFFFMMMLTFDFSIQHSLIWLFFLYKTMFPDIT